MKTVIITTLAALLYGLGPAMATNYSVNIQSFAFVPGGRHIIVGDMITWTNHDAVTHTSTSDNGVWNSGNIAPAGSFQHTFSSTGTFPYHCAIHTSMHDTIFVDPQTGVGETPTTPKLFELSQNYPNPFNAQTMIRYSLPQAGHVNIEVYNMLGQKIDALLDGEQTAGEHQITWNAVKQTSGVFFYKVNVDGAEKMGRMTLLK